MIARDNLTERLASLTASEKELWANLNATIGARLEVEYWLDWLDKQEAEPEEPTEE